MEFRFLYILLECNGQDVFYEDSLKMFVKDHGRCKECFPRGRAAKTFAHKRTFKPFKTVFTDHPTVFMTEECYLKINFDANIYFFYPKIHLG
jgi:hypothetical protein